MKFNKLGLLLSIVIILIIIFIITYSCTCKKTNNYENFRKARPIINNTYKPKPVQNIPVVNKKIISDQSTNGAAAGGLTNPVEKRSTNGKAVAGQYNRETSYIPAGYTRDEYNALLGN